MASSDTLTDTKVKETYTKLLQINDENELLDGIGGAVSPTIGGNLSVNGTIYQNGTALEGDTALWTQNSSGELTRTSNIGIGVVTNPTAKLHIDSNSDTEDFFLVRKTVGGLTDTVFKINNEGTMVLGGNSSAPTATAGAIYYDSSEKAFYLSTDD
jgi:hypothetical protein